MSADRGDSRPRGGAGPHRPARRRPRPSPRRRLPRGRSDVPSPARETALTVLLAAEQSGRFVADLVHRQIADALVSRADRALVTEMVNGVVRRRAMLDAVIAAYSDTKLWRLDGRLLWVLRLALYQMMCLTRVPARAAVDEAVRLARQHGLGHLAGFVNGILRTMSRSLTPAGALADRVVVARRVIPIDAEHTIVATRDVLPDPETDRVAHLAAAFSYPEWLVQRWLERFGPERVRAVLGAGNERPRIYLRANRLRTTRDDLAARLAEAGVQTRPTDLPEGLELVRGRATDGSPARAQLAATGGHALGGTLTNLPGFAEGLFYLQDLTAMGVAPRLRPQPGERVFDLCAAPGGKATHLAELMENTGEIVAADQSPDRLARVAENAQRLGTDIVRTAPADQVAGEFDAVLLDAPCTNTGVLARRAEARWRLSDASLDRAVAEQTALFEEAAGRVRPGGRLLYSTCSIEP